MAKWLVCWSVDWSIMPQDAADRIKRQMMMLQMVKADLASGTMTDFGIRSGESSGYGITGDLSEVALNAWLLKWSPYVTFEANPVVDANQQLEALQNLVEMMKKK